MLDYYQPGEVVLLTFPHTDGEGGTRRPAAVLLDIGDADIVVARITRQGMRDHLDVEVHDWHNAGLLYPSLIRPHKLATYLKSRVERRLGTLTQSDWNRLSQTVRSLWSVI